MGRARMHPCLTDGRRSERVTEEQKQLAAESVESLCRVTEERLEDMIHPPAPRR